MKSSIELLAILAIACTACGGGRHLSDYHGASYRAALAAQAPALKTAPREAVLGLDSQEAAIIAETYRKSLARKAETVKDEPILMVAPSRDRGGYQQMAPSVPK